MDHLERIRILSVDDHPLLREELAAIINSESDMILVSQASNGTEAIQQHREHRPDVTLMDLRLPDLSGIDAMMAIRAEFPDARVIILTCNTLKATSRIQRALQAGARGYLFERARRQTIWSRPSGRLRAGKKRVPPDVAAWLAEHMSYERLTTREVEVLQQVAGGNRNREIGERLFISEETVKVHMKHIMDKLGVKDRTQAIADRRAPQHHQAPRVSSNTTNVVPEESTLAG